MFPLISHWRATINGFLEDTSVCVCVAYLLARARPMKWITSRTPRSSIALGVLLGLIATTEIVFPGDRAPYRFDSFVVCFAMLVGSWNVGFIACAIVVLIALFSLPALAAFRTAVSLPTVAVVSGLFQFKSKDQRAPVFAALAVWTAQISSQTAIALTIPSGTEWWRAALRMSTPTANAFGMFLVMLVLKDAELRAASHRNRLDSERSRRLLVAADLAVLRARIRPHFLFNTLTAIAALCDIDPEGAQTNILRLATLMRRSLEVDTTSLVTLKTEIDYVRAFTDIQSARFGGKLVVEFRIAKGLLGSQLPAFCVHTLVENAYQHGYGSAASSGRIVVACSRVGQSLFLAVQDHGVGMPAEKREEIMAQGEQPKGGLGIIDRQLRLLYGNRGRLRYFSSPGNGTIVATRIPLSYIPTALK